MKREALHRIDAVAVPLARSHVDTDQIVPALYLQKPRAVGFANFLFHDVRRDADGQLRPDFPLNNPAYADARILVAGRNFGCGSSREHAVWALHDGGFRAVIAPSFGDIFYSNALKNGLLPVRQDEAMVQRLLTLLQDAPGSRLHLDVRTRILQGPDGLQAPFALDDFAQHCLLEGLDEIDFTLRQLALLRADTPLSASPSTLLSEHP